MFFHMPVRLYFGSGEIKNIGTIIKNDFKAKSLVLITDRGVVQAGLINNIVDKFDNIKLFDEVEANPKSDTINKIAARIRQIKPDLIIGVGGGSPLDAGKALALLATNDGDIEEYEGKEKYKNDPLPFLAVPTTCGTGSEVTWVSVITDVKRNFKISIKGPKMYPAVSIVDPDLIKTLPKHIIASTGLDALTHAIEAFLSIPATIITDINAIKAVKLILGSVEGAYNDILNNHQDRENLMYGSSIAGFAFGNSDVTAVHCISESIGALYDVPHGEANSIFLPYVLDYNMSACTDKMAVIARKVGIEESDDTKASRQFIDLIRRLSARLKIPSFKDLNIKKDQFDIIADMSYRNGSTPSNPRKLEQSDYLKILENAHAG
jgi:alcohol dehydrogenase